MPREIEGDWIWRWPDRKRPHLLEGKDSRGRVIFGRTPLLDLEGFITPVDSYYVVAQPQMPEESIREFLRTSRSLSMLKILQP